MPLPAHIPLSDIGHTNYERVMGHAPHILKPWVELEEAFFQRALLPQTLLEQVRRTLAQGHGCEYCQAKGGPPHTSRDDFRTSLAVGLAQIYSSDPKGIDEKMLQLLRAHFSDAEVVELIAYMGFMWAGGVFGKVMGIRPGSPRQARPE
ncbi:MAG: carboxymuconolactone decarboxylase family protein [Pseudomonadota bacterium]